MTFLSISTIVLSVYVLAESFGALVNLPAGIREQFCCKAKYISSVAASSAYIWYAATSDVYEIQWIIFISAAALAWFVWPRMVLRARIFLDELDKWEAM